MIRQPITPVEPEFPVRLIALDIDGTLVGEDLIVGRHTRDAVRAATARGVAVSLVTGRMVSSAMRFARELGLTDPIVGYQGGLVRAMPPPDSKRLGKLLVHTPLPATVAREIVAWTLARGLDPHLNHLERFILRANDPRADDYSAFMGARAELVPDLAGSISHPITKVLAVGEPPLPTEIASLAAAPLRRGRGRDDQPSPVPRVRRAGGLEGREPSAGWRDDSGSRSGPRSRWATSGTTWRCSPRSARCGHAHGTRRSGGRSIPRTAGRGGGVAALIESLVLSDPSAAREASRRLSAEAATARAVADEGS